MGKVVTVPIGTVKEPEQEVYAHIVTQRLNEDKLWKPRKVNRLEGWDGSVPTLFAIAARFIDDAGYSPTTGYIIVWKKKGESVREIYCYDG